MKMIEKINKENFLDEAKYLFFFHYDWNDGKTWRYIHYFFLEKFHIINVIKRVKLFHVPEH